MAAVRVLRVVDNLARMKVPKHPAVVPVQLTQATGSGHLRGRNALRKFALPLWSNMLRLLCSVGAVLLPLYVRPLALPHHLLLPNLLLCQESYVGSRTRGRNTSREGCQDSAGGCVSSECNPETRARRQPALVHQRNAESAADSRCNRQRQSCSGSH